VGILGALLVIGQLVVGLSNAHMKPTRFCLVSLLLVVSALGAQFAALKSWSQNAEMRARAVSASEGQRVSMRADADRLTERGSVFYYAGLALAITGAASVMVSIRRHELAAWRSVPVVLLILYVMFQFVLV
jgi:hypothetical protein